MLTARNLLLVVSHTPAGDYHLDMFYKTDLETIKTAKAAWTSST